MDSGYGQVHFEYNLKKNVRKRERIIKCVYIRECVCESNVKKREQNAEPKIYDKTR